ncbi:MAG: DNA primase [Deltaproteobacteria bacterium]|nr:MAG: DNA primase [Deltaproteobacteria bacterium]
MGGLIPEAVLEEIRQRADIVEVISDYVTLKKAGRNYKGLCPFHQEKTPSFVVSEEKQLFHCFGCGVGGNVFSFLMKYEQISFAEAAKVLAQRYGVKIPEVRVTAKDNRKENLFKINTLALKFYVHQLMEGKEGRDARDYLQRRGISREVWEEYRLGYAPSRWDALLTYLKEKGANLKEAESLGLIIPKKGGWYDRFRGRIIFPIFDLRDRVIGFGGRILEDGKEPKYLNSPESSLYKKGENFYGLNIARKYIQKEGGRVYIVEGYFDLLSMSQKGVKNVVATLGTALTPGQVRLLRRFAKEFSLIFDPDEAGKKAAVRALEIFIQEDLFPKVVPLPDGLDPDSYFQKGFSLQALWEREVGGVEYAIETLVEGHDLDEVEGRAKAAEAALPFLVQIKDGVRRGLYLRHLAEKVKVEEAKILDAARKISKGKKEDEGKELITRVHISAGKTLVQMMIQHPEYIPLVAQEGVMDGLEDQDLRAIAELVIQDFQLHGGLSLDRLSPQLEERGVSEMAFHLAFQEEEMEEGTAERIVSDCLNKIKMKLLKKELEDLTRRIKEAQTRGDEALLNSLLLRKKTLKLKEERLKRGLD